MGIADFVKSTQGRIAIAAVVVLILIVAVTWWRSDHKDKFNGPPIAGCAGTLPNPGAIAEMAAQMALGNDPSREGFSSRSMSGAAAEARGLAQADGSAENREGFAGSWYGCHSAAFGEGAATDAPIYPAQPFYGAYGQQHLAGSDVDPATRQLAGAGVLGGSAAYNMVLGCGQTPDPRAVAEYQGTAYAGQSYGKKAGSGVEGFCTSPAARSEYYMLGALNGYGAAGPDGDGLLRQYRMDPANQIYMPQSVQDIDDQVAFRLARGARAHVDAMRATRSGSGASGHAKRAIHESVKEGMFGPSGYGDISTSRAAVAEDKITRGAGSS
jgi:hypothetical protein